MTSSLNSSIAESPQFEYCNKLEDFHTFFNRIHYRLSLIICIFGCITNILNLIVLTQKSLRNSINFILAALAISDFCVMIVYIPYAFDYGFDMNTRNERLTYNYATWILMFFLWSQVTHTISIFLTVMLALWRVVSVCYPNRKTIFMKRTVSVILICYILSPILSIPNYIAHNIEESNMTIAVNATTNTSIISYRVLPSEFARRHQLASLWIYSVIIKLLPCILLTFFSLKLIKALYEAKKRKQKLAGNLSLKLLTKKKQADRTTRMLTVVLLLFILTEFPQGILGLLSALLGEAFYRNCYHKFGDLMDFLALLNSSINFILYCTMSRQFRETFSNIFIPDFCKPTAVPINASDGLMEMDSRGQIETIQDTQMTQL